MNGWDDDWVIGYKNHTKAVSVGFSTGSLVITVLYKIYDSRGLFIWDALDVF